MLEPKKSLVDAATGTIRDRILDLTLPPGLPIDNKWLVSNLKLSRTPIREALNRLAAEGLIRFEANHGVFVHPLDVDEISQLMKAYGVAERISAFYCDFEDPGLAADVVRMQASQRAALVDHHYLQASHWNAAFRNRIAESSRNHHLIDFCRRLVNHSRRLSCLIYGMEARRPAYYDSQLGMLTGLHMDIEEAIAAKDRDRLMAVLSEQVAIFRSRIATVLGAADEREFPLS